MCSHFQSLSTALFKHASIVVARLLDFMVSRSLTVKNNNHRGGLPPAGTSRMSCGNSLHASGVGSSVTIIHSMDWEVIMSSYDGILLHDRRWQSLAHQLGFNIRLIDVWGDVLPSTLALFKKDVDPAHKYLKNICCDILSCGYCKSVAFIDKLMAIVRAGTVLKFLGNQGCSVFSIDSIIGMSSGSACKTCCRLDIRFINLELLPY